MRWSDTRTLVRQWTRCVMRFFFEGRAYPYDSYGLCVSLRRVMFNKRSRHARIGG
jgi:hypothetical protein